MGTVRKIGVEYFIEFEARGLKYQQKAGTDEQEAWRLLAEIEGKIRQGEMGVVTRDVHVIAFLDDFLSAMAKQYPAATVSRLRAVLKHFKVFLQAEFSQLEFLSQVTPKVVESYKSYLCKTPRPGGKPRKTNVTNLTLLLMREVFEHGIKLGFLNDNPGLHVHFLASETANVKLMSDDDLAMVLSLAPDPLRQIAKIILVTGLHPNEVCRLRWSDIDEKAGVIFAGKEKAAGHSYSPRQIPLVPAVLEILSAFERPSLSPATFVFGGSSTLPISWSDLELEWQECCRQSRVRSAYHLNDLRHIFASQASTRGVSLLRLSIFLGYSDVAGVVKYIRFIPDIHKRFQQR